MSNELTTPEADALKQWQEMNNVTPFSRPNEITLVNTPFDGEEKNPEYGKLFATYSDESGDHRVEIPLDKANFKFIASKIQIKCARYEDGEPLVRVSGEINDTRTDYITVTPVNGDEVRGLYNELKDGYPIKYTENIYVEWEGRVFRWNLTGAHFDSWFKVKNQLKKFPHYLRVTGLKDEKTGTNVYKSLIFAVGETYDVMEAVALRKEVDELFKPSAHVEASKQIEEATLDEAIAEAAPQDVKKN